jgi:hypothetical protein
MSEPIDRLTLDTNLLFAVWFEDANRLQHVEELVRLAEAGKVALAVTRYVEDDVPRDPLASRLGEFDLLNIARTGGVFTLDVSLVNGGDGLGDQAMEDLRVAVSLAHVPGEEPIPGGVDWMHLHAHMIQGRDYFLTWDKPILRLRDRLAELGVIVMKPEDYLEARAAPSPGGP